MIWDMMPENAEVPAFKDVNRFTKRKNELWLHKFDTFTTVEIYQNISAFVNEPWTT